MARLFDPVWGAFAADELCPSRTATQKFGASANPNAGTGFRGRPHSTHALHQRNNIPIPIIPELLVTQLAAHQRSPNANSIKLFASERVLFDGTVMPWPQCSTTHEST